ncbi:MAG: hypothetical protein GXO32_01800 [Crenarchaeota archaeon]|nr:hypothetical protein [Thermoproteota archaeon]
MPTEEEERNEAKSRLGLVLAPVIAFGVSFGVGAGVGYAVGGPPAYYGLLFGAIVTVTLMVVRVVAWIRERRRRIL